MRPLMQGIVRFESCVIDRPDKKTAEVTRQHQKNRPKMGERGSRKFSTREFCKRLD
jgi:hypothetical protein